MKVEFEKMPDGSKGFLCVVDKGEPTSGHALRTPAQPYGGKV